MGRVDFHRSTSSEWIFVHYNHSCVQWVYPKSYKWPSVFRLVSITHQVNVHFWMTERTTTIGPNTSSSTYNDRILANIVDCKSWIDLQRDVSVRPSEDCQHSPVCLCSQIEYFDSHHGRKLVRYVSVCLQGINLGWREVSRVSDRHLPLSGRLSRIFHPMIWWRELRRSHWHWVQEGLLFWKRRNNDVRRTGKMRVTSEESVQYIIFRCSFCCVGDVYDDDDDDAEKSNEMEQGNTHWTANEWLSRTTSMIVSICARCHLRLGSASEEKPKETTACPALSIFLTARWITLVHCESTCAHHATKEVILLCGQRSNWNFSAEICES